MIIGKVTGTVVCTQKDAALNGEKMLVIQPINIENLNDLGAKMVALDSIGAGKGEFVVIVGGSSARLAHGYGKVPVDYCIVGIVDTIEIMGKNILLSGERSGQIG